MKRRNGVSSLALLKSRLQETERKLQRLKHIGRQMDRMDHVLGRTSGGEPVEDGSAQLRDAPVIDRQKLWREVAGGNPAATLASMLLRGGNASLRKSNSQLFAEMAQSISRAMRRNL